MALSLGNHDLRRLLASTRPRPAELTARQRVGLCVGTTLTRDFVTTCSVESLNSETLSEGGVTIMHYFVLDYSVATLRALGFGLRELAEAGLDMLWLVKHASFASDLIATYEAGPVRDAFLNSAADAVALVSEEWMQDLLSCSPDQLLETTLGTMRATRTVFQSFSKTQIASCCPDTIVRVGLRREDLPFTDGYIMAYMQPSVQAARALGIY